MHYVLWKSGAPRFDIRAEKLEIQAGALRKAGLVAGGTGECRIEDVIDFFAECISKWNPNTSKDGVEATSHVAERINEAHEHTATWSAEDMLWLLQEENAAERLEYYKRAVRTEHLHDFRYPDSKARSICATAGTVTLVNLCPSWTTSPSPRMRCARTSGVPIYAGTTRS